MTVSVITNPNQSIEDSPRHFMGLSSDTKPTVASHAGLPEPTKGSLCWEYDTGRVYKTYDGTTWAKTVDYVVKKVSRTKALIGGAYSAKDVLSESATNGAGTAWIFADVVPELGGAGTIIAAMAISETANISPALTVFLSNITPTAELDDNAANTAPAHADLAGQVGKLDFDALDALGGDSVGVPYRGLPQPFVCAAADNKLYGVVMTNTAFTQGAGDDLTIVLWILQA